MSINSEVFLLLRAAYPPNSLLGYSFKNQNNELGGYTILNNKKITLIMDVGSSPDKKFHPTIKQVDYHLKLYLIIKN